MADDEKIIRSRFQRHVNILIWKSYLQRQRRWRVLVAVTLFAGMLFLGAVFIAKPVFLTPLQAEPEPPLTKQDILNSLNPKIIVGYAPNTGPYPKIMARVVDLLNRDIISAATEDDLNNDLYETSKGTPISTPIIWIIFKEKEGAMWKVSIRSTERARYETSEEMTSYPNPHLRAGFLAIQLAISQAIVEHEATSSPRYEISLVSMPVSPLMEEVQVRRALSGILFCFTLALIPPVLETVTIVVHETLSRYKRALRIRDVDYTAMYVGWLVYAFLTALPICMLASLTIILIFRWIHLIFALMLMLAYVTVMIMLAFIMAMFQSKAMIACVWTSLFTFLQTYLAELLVHHQYGLRHGAATFLLHVALPPLGLVHAFNQFALLQTGRGSSDEAEISMVYTLVSWSSVILLYFLILMMLQRTIGQERAIGGQVSWKSIIFKQVEDVNEVRPIETPTGRERDPLQEVDELVAKAISFRNVSKKIMDVPVLSNLTLDIYRGEFTMLFAERIQDKMISTIEDLLTGLTYADKGTINVLGHKMKPSANYMNVPHMMGYCHRSIFLIDDLTVEEHLVLYLDISLWAESRQYISEYGDIRTRRLITECNLETVRHERVRFLDEYYRAQLCWAIAVLLEPRIVMMPNFTDAPSYVSVIKDKIRQYNKYMTIVKMCFSSIRLEYADRVFLFDSKILTFGGTPAYMFFKYGREYRVRMTIRSDGTFDDESTKALLDRAAAAGATVRAHLGSLLILRLPASPTDSVANLVKDLFDNANKYGMTSLNISVPDSEEVYKRAITEARAERFEPPAACQLRKDALKRIAEPVTWKRKQSNFSNMMQLKQIGWKYYTFHLQHRIYFLITLLSAIAAGVMIGMSFSLLLSRSERDNAAKKLLHGEILTVEHADQKTTLVIRSDNTSQANSVANAYVLSEPNATPKQVEKILYTAITKAESLTEYLVTRAIDSPQLYVYMYAYGLDVNTNRNGTLIVKVLYCPLHYDYGAAARSMARSYTALLRHYTDNYAASIQVTDDPLALDLTPWMRYATKPPLFIQFLLILSVFHITLIPSKEYGLIRHLQSHAMNFTPARYWFMLYLCDLILFWILVTLMTVILMIVMYLVAPSNHFQYSDLLIIPLVLIVYGAGCIPQAYLFSMGPRVALNSVTFIIVNIVFGETTIIAQLLYGDTLNFAMFFMSLSPQFNLAYALVKIKQVFLYNSECIIFKSQNLCSAKTLHKCCKKCGVLQKCFFKMNYFTPIYYQVTALIITSLVFMAILLVLEYKVLNRVWKKLKSKWTASNEQGNENVAPGAAREKRDVLDKMQQILKKSKRNQKIDTFGEYLLAQNLTSKEMGAYAVHSIYLGLGKGEALAMSGLKRHGRQKLCEMLAGFRLPSEGNVWCMSKWKQETDPHTYARHISFCCNRQSLPQWMTVYDALELLAMLRGVPKKHVKAELLNYIQALELQDQADTPIYAISQRDMTRLHFAAAVVGAPPVILLDECTAYQKFSVRRAMYFILYHLRKRGHAVFISSSSVESHMPVTNRMAIILDGSIYDIDTVDNLVSRYSTNGYTVVVHLKDEIDVFKLFAKYFRRFVINDTTDVLVNVQVLDADLNWATIFQKMESLKKANQQVYSYIVTIIPIDYIYNSILLEESGTTATGGFVSIIRKRAKIKPTNEMIAQLKPLEQKYAITKLRELPWSVMFHQ